MNGDSVDILEFALNRNARLYMRRRPGNVMKLQTAVLIKLFHKRLVDLPHKFISAWEIFFEEAIKELPFSIS